MRLRSKISGNKTGDITLKIRLRSEVGQRLDQLAERTGRAKSILASEAIADFVERELGAVEAIERGLEDVKTGRVVTHEQAMREVRQTIGEALKAGRRGGSAGRGKP